MTSRLYVQNDTNMSGLAYLHHHPSLSLSVSALCGHLPTPNINKLGFGITETLCDALTTNVQQRRLLPEDKRMRLHLACLRVAHTIRLKYSRVTERDESGVAARPTFSPPLRMTPMFRLGNDVTVAVDYDNMVIEPRAVP